MISEKPISRKVDIFRLYIFLYVLLPVRTYIHTSLQFNRLLLNLQPFGSLKLRLELCRQFISETQIKDQMMSIRN